MFFKKNYHFSSTFSNFSFQAIAQNIDVIVRNFSCCSLIGSVEILTKKSSSMGEIPDENPVGRLYPR